MALRACPPAIWTGTQPGVPAPAASPDHGSNEVKSRFRIKPDRINRISHGTVLATARISLLSLRSGSQNGTALEQESQ